MTICLAKTLKVALLGCVIALGAARTADAAYVVINADPAFGGTSGLFPNLGWRATGALYVPDACKDLPVNQGGSPPPVVLVPIGGPSANCQQSRMQDVKLYLYDTRDPLKTALDTIDINYYFADVVPSSSRHDLSQELLDFSLSNGELLSFHTTLSAPRLATSQVAGLGSYRFSLEFSSDTARLVAFGAEGTVTYEDAVDESTRPATITIGRFMSDAAYAQLTVPEPGSMFLTLAALAAALGAGSFARRSRG